MVYCAHPSNPGSYPRSETEQKMQTELNPDFDDEDDDGIMGSPTWWQHVWGGNVSRYRPRLSIWQLPASISGPAATQGAWFLRFSKACMKKERRVNSTRSVGEVNKQVSSLEINRFKYSLGINIRCGLFYKHMPVQVMLIHSERSLRQIWTVRTVLRLASAIIIGCDYNDVGWAARPVLWYSTLSQCSPHQPSHLKLAESKTK